MFWNSILEVKLRYFSNETPARLAYYYSLYCPNGG